ncbi:MAG: putative RDD family membrane protein YckC [Saprospiraceae bacterium]|jgi:uncharacterized RDD family membrane protein YckC
MIRPIFSTCLNFILRAAKAKPKQVLIIFCLLIGYGSVLSQITVSAALDNSQVLIGDQAKLHLEATYPADHVIGEIDLSVLDSIFSEKDVTKGERDPGILEILDQTEWEALANGGNTTYRKDITLTCWDEGVYYIPQIRFNLAYKGTNITRATNKLTLLVSSPLAANEVADTVAIAPIKDIIKEERRLSDYLPVLYLIGGILLFILAVTSLIVYIIRKKQGPPPITIVKRPAHEIAFHKLNQLKAAELWQKGEVKNYQSQLTYISREYIENRYAIPALESTTGEILNALKKAEFPEDLVEKMREMLQLADMVKFAKAKPPDEMHSRLMDFAGEIVQTTKLEVSAEDQQKLQSATPGVEGSFIVATRYAHRGRRFLAFVVDSFISQLVIIVLLFISSLLINKEDNGGIAVWSILLPLIAYFVFGFFYYAYMHAKYKQTLGKKLLGIELVHSSGKNITLGKAFLRFFIKTLSFLFLYLPFLPIFFNKQKQGLHDMVVNSVVVKKLSNI